MQSITTRWGEVEIKPENIVNFPQGLPAFTHARQFIILQPENPVSVLQCIEDTSLSFPVINPYTVVADYQLDVPEEDLVELEVADVNKVLVYVLLVIAHTAENTTVNLLAPVVINAEKMLAKQIIMTGDLYRTEYRLFAR
ncbi:MAG: flagellar assembly protein FliW [Peptococcaceae bacterium]|nr:flagellar assembly protein FliW [Peptococcaceae bacterium]